MSDTSTRSLSHWATRLFVVLAIALIAFVAIYVWIFSFSIYRSDSRSRAVDVLGHRVEWKTNSKVVKDAKPIDSRYTPHLMPLTTQSMTAQHVPYWNGNNPSLFGQVKVGDQALFGSRPTPRSASVSQATVGDSELDQRSIEIARQLSATQISQRDEQKIQELRTLLNESFTNKQRIHEQRLAKLSEELAKTKETLEKRKANQTEIVERRMNELLDGPDVMSWEYDPRKPNSVAPGVVPLDSQWSVPLNKAPDESQFLRLKPQVPDLSMLGSLLLGSLKDLKEGKKGTNRSAIESMTSKTRYFESSWSDRKQEFQISDAKLTKQIDELNKLVKSGSYDTDESMRKVVEFQIQSLTEQREQLAISVKWMNDFEANQLAEFQKLRELVTPEEIVKPQEKTRDEPVPTESK